MSRLYKTAHLSVKYGMIILQSTGVSISSKPPYRAFILRSALLLELEMEGVGHLKSRSEAVVIIQCVLIYFFYCFDWYIPAIRRLYNSVY